MNATEFNPCILIPSYNHSDYLPALLGNLKPYGLDTVIIDDGSQPLHQERIRHLSQEHSNVSTVRLEENQGKGGAVIAGLQWAHNHGYSHSIQIDSDGQHDLNSLDELIRTSKNNPEGLISGCPVYGDDIPSSRKWGRLLTMFWVWIETLSFQIRDAMCGFRSYPLKNCIPILKNKKIGRGMDFDIELMVRYHWTGNGVKQIPVKVNYPEDGKSHFRMFYDNLLISWMHTRLCFGMIFRLPVLLYRKLKPNKETQWSEISESGMIIGIKTLLIIYKVFGRRILKLSLYPVVFYYYLFNSRARQSSQDFFARYKKWCLDKGHKPKPTSSFKHIYCFANMVLDKIAVWRGDIKMKDLDFPNQLEIHSNIERGEGLFFLTAHFGNIEVCRAIGQSFPEIKINILVYHDNAKKINSVISGVSEDAKLNLISVKNFGVDTAILLREKIENGEWIFIMGDRISPTSQDKKMKCNFLGEEALFPFGPFVLAELMGAPIYSMHCFPSGDKYAVRTKLISSHKSARKDRMQDVLNSYVFELENMIQQEPHEWFNFFHFWDVE